MKVLEKGPVRQRLAWVPAVLTLPPEGMALGAPRELCSADTALSQHCWLPRWL